MEILGMRKAFLKGDAVITQDSQLLRTSLPVSEHTPASTPGQPQGP